MFTFCKIIVENANKIFVFFQKRIDKKAKKWYNKKDECYLGAHFLPFAKKGGPRNAKR
jgi:hypothetical protein